MINRLLSCLVFAYTRALRASVTLIFLHHNILDCVSHLGAFVQALGRHSWVRSGNSTDSGLGTSLEVDSAHSHSLIKVIHVSERVGVDSGILLSVSSRLSSHFGVEGVH